MPSLELVTVVPARREIVFDLARDVVMHVESFRDRGQAVVGGRSSGLLVLGDRITWRARHFGIPWHMTMKVTGFERPRWFREQVVSGPFRSFMHDRYFDAVEGGTRMHDVLTFHSPLGPLGRMTDRLILEDHLDGLLRARAGAIVTAAVARATEGVAGGGPPVPGSIGPT